MASNVALNVFPPERDDGGSKTLLDDFAGQAMQALLSSSSTRDHEHIARASYDYAEAMVAEKRRRERRV